MNSTQKASTMSGIGNNKGFTLIEMAIVLVIIGIILGAVMKGQDLITNAKAKNITSTANNWKALVYAYADRNGRMPGDTARAGQIAGTTANPTTRDALFQLYSTMSQAPANPVSVGGQQFWFYLANDAGTAGRNVMVICNSATCATAFTNDDVELIKTIDSSIDGTSDAGAGNFRAITTGVFASGVPTGAVLFHDDTSKVSGTAGIMTITRANVLNTVGSQWAPTTLAAVYYFDKSY